MATKFTSSQVAAGAAILAAQENAMRLDMLKNAGDYATSTGSANAYLLAVDSQISAYVAGDVFKFNASFANTGAATLNVNSIGAKSILKDHDVALEANDIESGQVVMVEYDGTNLQMISQKGVDLSSASKTTLGAGATSDASALHYHKNDITGLNLWMHIDSTETSVTIASGFSDATVKLFAAGFHNSGGTATAAVAFSYEISGDVGRALFLTDKDSYQDVDDVSGCLFIGTDSWTANNDSTAGARIMKNGVSVTISGTTPSASAQLGHDPTNSYLLLLDSTTTIKRYSGISGTTITYVDSITLDTAVSSSAGFMFDNTNSRYICIDSTNNVIRRFNSSGTTVDTVAYTISEATMVGLCMLKDRVYIVSNYISQGVSDSDGVSMDLIPTAMTR